MAALAARKQRVVSSHVLRRGRQPLLSIVKRVAPVLCAALFALPSALFAQSGAETIKYDGFVHDDAGTMYGTIALTVKMALNSGIPNWTFTGKAVMQDKTINFTAKDTGMKTSFEFFAKTGEIISLTLESDTFFGTIYSSDSFLNISGARAVFADKNDPEAQARLEKVRGQYNMALIDVVGGEMQGYVTLNIGNLGKVKITGSLSDGTKVSSSAALLEGVEVNGWHCIALHCPLYSKKGFISGLLWLNPKDKVISVGVYNGWFVDWVSNDPMKGPAKPLALDVVGGYFGDGKVGPTIAPGLLFDVDIAVVNLPSPAPNLVTGAKNPYGWVIDALPLGIPVNISGGKLVLPKATKPKINSDPPDVVYWFDGENPCGATLTHTPKTGVFKGKFNLYYQGMNPARGANWETKIISMSYSGVLVPYDGQIIGLGTGTATIGQQKVGLPVYLWR